LRAVRAKQFYAANQKPHSHVVHRPRHGAPAVTEDIILLFRSVCEREIVPMIRYEIGGRRLKTVEFNKVKALEYTYFYLP
jgi:hypothetical protein